MDPGTVISSLNFAYSLIPEQESASEKRHRIFDSVVGQEIAFVPEVGEKVELQLRNCAFADDEGATYLTVSIHDPNRPNDLLDIETDIRYHYVNMYLMRATELGNPLVDKMNFVELGPQDFKVELRVKSVDPPTLQLAFERVEMVLAQVHTHYHRLLRATYERYKDEFEVVRFYEDGKTRFEAQSDLEEQELRPLPPDEDFEVQTIDENFDGFELFKFSHHAYDYIEYSVAAEAGKDQFFTLT